MSWYRPFQKTSNPAYTSQILCHRASLQTWLPLLQKVDCELEQVGVVNLATQLFSTFQKPADKDFKFLKVIVLGPSIPIIN